MEQKLQQFEQRTGINFFNAYEEHYFDIDDELKHYNAFDMDSISNLTDEQFDKLFNTIDGLVGNRKTGAKDKRIDQWFQDSALRCAGLVRTVNHGAEYDLLEVFKDEDKIKGNLVHNNAIAFNPYLLVNEWCPSECRCIFKPSARALRMFKFLKPIYYKGSRTISHYNIDVDYLRKYNTIDLHEDDILEIYWGMYSPYLWGLIQNNKFTGLIHNLKC